MAPGTGRRGQRLHCLTESCRFRGVNAQPSGAQTCEILPERRDRSIVGERVEGRRPVLGILLTEPEEALDRVTQELAQIFDVPGAYISFIDEDTQYYKSAFGGLPEPFATTRTEPRADSLCSHVVGMNGDQDGLPELARQGRPGVSPRVGQHMVCFV